MRFIVEFFEYKITGIVYFLYFVVMMICSFACLGVVGDKVSKKKHAELMAKREKAAQEEYRKAQELIEKQAQSAGVNNVLDPTAAKPATPQAAPVASQPTQVAQPAQAATPVVDNISEDAVNSEVPAVLVINEDGTSGS